MIKLPYNDVKKYIESFGYILLSTEYMNNKTKLELKCPEGHIYNARYDNFQHGDRCKECAGLKKHDIDYVKKYIESFNYILLSTEYKNNKSYLKLQCPEGHIYNVIYNSFQKGRRCPKCSNSKMFSKPEKEIVEYIKTFYINKVIENDRTQILNYWTGFNLELDTWLPELNKAIEFNGMHWHNNDKSRWYDEMKVKQCIQKNIKLLVIQEQDWYDDKNKCLKTIYGHLND